MSSNSANDTSNENTSAQKLKVFISYSRVDMAFADELVAGLEYDGNFEVFIDRHDIHEGEEWRSRLRGLILNADTVIFVLSKTSATSPICQWEVEESEKHSKRILPIQIEDLSGTNAPPQLAALNYIIFKTDSSGHPTSFMTGLTALRRALNTDVGWLREHTRLLARAEEWNIAGRVPNRMLLGSDITDAKAWLESKPKDAPSPTELHHDFIQASEREEITRTSVERERANKLEQALKEAEQARIQEIAASRKVLRRTIYGIVGSIALAVAGLSLGWGYKVWEERQDFQREVNRKGINGEIIAYATAKGEAAMDSFKDASGKRIGSPYTTSVVEAFREHKTRSITDVLTGAGEIVLKRSGVRQRPFLSTSMNGKLFLWHQPKTRRRLALVVWLDYAKNRFARPLESPEKDAAAMIKLLKDAGYSDNEIIVLANPKRKELILTLRKLRKFGQSKIKKSKLHTAKLISASIVVEKKKGSSHTQDDAFKDLPEEHETPKQKRGLVPVPKQTDDSKVLFYFSGNGFATKGDEYILPQLEEKMNVEDADFLALKVETIVNSLSDAFRSSIFIFDTNFTSIDTDNTAR